MEDFRKMLEGKVRRYNNYGYGSVRKLLVSENGNGFTFRREKTSILGTLGEPVEFEVVQVVEDAKSAYFWLDGFIEGEKE